MGRFGVVVNAFAVLYGIGMIINLFWPRGAVYGTDHWYYQWGALLTSLLILIVGGVMFQIRRRTWAVPHDRAVAHERAVAES
jgi:hypothetical protein